MRMLDDEMNWRKLYWLIKDRILLTNLELFGAQVAISVEVAKEKNEWGHILLINDIYDKY